MSTWQYNKFSDFRKEQELTASNYFFNKGKSNMDLKVQDKSPYILKERNDWHRNIIVNSVFNYVNEKKAESKNSKISYPLHKYIHHGLSSQSMLFNLFGEPLIKKDYAFFQEVFQTPEIQIDSKYELKFEHYDRETFNEKTQQPTSFDFAIIDKTGTQRNIFVEAKYVEPEFGGCSTIEGGECDGLNPISNPDLCYLTFKGRNYWKLMKKYGLDVPYANSPICPLAIYYQFFRELMFALENNGYFVILIDKRNPAFEKESSVGKRGLIPVLMDKISPKHKEFVKIIYIQDVLPILDKHGYTWVDEFREKYGMW